MMKLRTAVTVVIAVIALGVSISEAAEDIAKVRAELQKILQDVPISSVKATAIDGLYEVESLYDVLYYAPKSEQIIFGNIFTRDGENITANAKAAIVTRNIASLDLTKAVKSGSGRNSVIEFTDPDCPHCRNAFEYWQNVPDVTRYTFLFPIAESHPQAVDKSEWILSQKDKVAALNEVFSGKHDKIIPKGATGEGKRLLKEHALNSEKAYVIGTPLYFVNGKLLPGVNVEAFEAALLQPEEKNAEDGK
jgi:thiol:disulfide interchange protein DsbC